MTVTVPSSYHGYSIEIYLDGYSRPRMRSRPNTPVPLPYDVIPRYIGVSVTHSRKFWFKEYSVILANSFLQCI